MYAINIYPGSFEMLLKLFYLQLVELDLVDLVFAVSLHPKKFLVFLVVLIKKPATRDDFV